RRDPAWIGYAVVVGDRDDVLARGCDGGVARAGEPALGAGDVDDRRIEAANDVLPLPARPLVDDDDLRGRLVAVEERAQAALEPLRPPQRGDGDGERRAHAKSS